MRTTMGLDRANRVIDMEAVPKLTSVSQMASFHYGDARDPPPDITRSIPSVLILRRAAPATQVRPGFPVQRLRGFPLDSESPPWDSICCTLIKFDVYRRRRDFPQALAGTCNRVNRCVSGVLAATIEADHSGQDSHRTPAKHVRRGAACVEVPTIDINNELA